MRQIVRAADGVEIVYTVQGQGVPTLVFVHGWCCNRTHWQHQVAHFARSHTVVTVDLAGHGESGRSREAGSVPTFGADVAAVVEQLDLAQVVIVGHSLGGTVGVAAAQQLPARVVGLVAVDTFKQLGQIRTPAEIDTLAHEFGTDFVRAADRLVRGSMFGPDADPAFVARIAQELAAAPAHIAVDALVRLYGYDQALQTALRELPIPKQMINADYKPTDSAAAARLGVQVEIMPCTGHFVMLQEPAAFNRRLEQTVARIAGMPVAV